MCKITARIGEIERVVTHIEETPRLDTTFKEISISSGEYPIYNGVYEATPKAFETTVLHTKDRVLKENITVLEIPSHAVENESGGSTFYIAQEVEAI